MEQIKKIHIFGQLWKKNLKTSQCNAVWLQGIIQMVRESSKSIVYWNKEQNRTMWKWQSISSSWMEAWESQIWSFLAELEGKIKPNDQVASI